MDQPSCTSGLTKSKITATHQNSKHKCGDCHQNFRGIAHGHRRDRASCHTSKTAKFPGVLVAIYSSLVSLICRIATVDESKKARKQYCSLNFLLYESCILTREETTKNEVLPSFRSIPAFTIAIRIIF